MSLVRALTNAVGSAVNTIKKTATEALTKSSSGSSKTSSSSGSSKTSSSSTLPYGPSKEAVSAYTPKGSNTDSYIKESSPSDYAKIQSAKQAYTEAQARGDEAGMRNANATANAVREKYGYSGGSDGSEYIPISKQEEAVNPYEDAMYEIQERYDRIAEQQRRANELAVRQGTARLQNQQGTINKSYDENARQAYIANMQDRKNLPQQLAANGLTGGATETANLKLQTNYENNLNDINNNRTDALTEIDNAIIELKNSGDLSAAQQALATSESALNAYQNYLNSKINYDIAQQDKTFNSQLSTLSQYSNDYQAEIDRRSAINPDDPLIPYLVAARQEKINTQKANESESMNEAIEQERELAWNVFQETGKANSYVEAVLGIPAGTTTLAYSKNQYDTSKPYYKTTSTGSASATGSTSGKTSNEVNYQTHQNIIENNYALLDPYGNKTGYNTDKIQDYVEREMRRGRLSKRDGDSLLAYYGVGNATSIFYKVASALVRTSKDPEKDLFNLYQQGRITEEEARKLNEEL